MEALCGEGYLHSCLQAELPEQGQPLQAGLLHHVAQAGPGDGEHAC